MGVPSTSIWARLTPLSMSLVMILLVATPYLVGLIALVASYGTLYKNTMDNSTQTEPDPIKTTTVSTTTTKWYMKYEKTPSHSAFQDDDIYPIHSPPSQKIPYSVELTIPTSATEISTSMSTAPEIVTSMALSTDLVTYLTGASSKPSNETETTGVTTSSSPIMEDDDISRYKRRYKRKSSGCSPCPEVKKDNYGNLICPEFEKIDYPNVAAFMEQAFIDDKDSNDFRYKCAAVVINENYVLTSAECVTKTGRSISNYDWAVRAGSNFWGKGGSFHEVTKLIYPPTGTNTFVLAKVDPPFPKIQTIADVTYSDQDIHKVPKFHMVRWITSSVAAYHHRTRALKIESTSFMKEAQCTHCSYSSTCVLESSKHLPCSEYYLTSGNPIFESGKLIGMQVKATCNKLKKTVERCFEPFDDGIKKWIAEQIQQ